MGDRTVAVKLRMDVGDYTSKAGQAKAATGDLLDKMDSSKKSTSELSTAMTVAGGALAGGFLIAVKSAADFDKQMSEVAAVSGATGKELSNLRGAALAAGAATAFSATEAAKAEAELAKAGLSTAEILGGALRGSMALASAGGIDLAEAADITAKAMNIFGLSGNQATHVADLLAAAANKSATDVHEMGLALKQGGLAGKAAGMSIEETTGVLALFADNALSGSDGGTSFKTMLMALENPTKKAANTMKDLGIQTFDSAGNFVGAEKLAGNLQEALGHLSQQQRNAALGTIFGSDAMRAANILYESGSTKVHDYIDAMNQQGAAADVAHKKMDNLSGDMERLRGSVETLAIQSGSGANSGLRTLTQHANGLVDAFAAIPAPVQQTATVLAGLAGVGLLGATGLMKVKKMGGEALEALAGMGPAGEKAATGLGKAGSAAAKAAVGIGAALVAIQLVGVAWKAFVDQPKETPMSDLMKGLVEFSATGKAGAGTIDLFGSKLERLDRDLKSLSNNGLDNAAHRWSAFLEGMSGTSDTEGTFSKSRANIMQLDEALANMVQSGHADDAANAYTRIAAEAKKGGISTAELKSGFEQYNAALDGATSTEQKTIAVNEANATSVNALKGTLLDAIDALGSFSAAFEQMNGGQIDMAKATIASEQAIDDMTASLKDNKIALAANGTSFDLTTEAGRKNQAALDGVAESAAKTAQAIYDQTGSVAQAGASFEGYRQQLINTMVQAGLTRAQAEKLADAYMKIPPVIQTRLNLYGSDNAAAQIQAIKDSLDRLPGTKTINIVTKEQLPSGLSMGALMHRADGGVVEFYAGGGVREAHNATIAPAGTWRVWAEPETGGEAYIPLAQGKRDQSIAVLADVNRRFGYPLLGGGAILNAAMPITVNAAPGMDAGQVAAIVDDRVANGLDRVARRLASGMRN